jgi:WS/DGAT/MGAT family acyltransferase
MQESQNPVAPEGLGHVSEERLSLLDTSFLHLEEPTGLLHVGALCLLDGPLPFEAFSALLASRLGALARFRQRPVRPALALHAPAWERDPDFDLARHARHIRLPPPGGGTELHQVVDDLFARPFDHRHPLWETYVIEGLRDGTTAIFTKVHHCMIDGMGGAPLLELLTDPAPEGAGDRAAAPAPPAEEAAAPSRSTVAALGAGALAGVRGLLAVAASPAAALSRVRQTLTAAEIVARLSRGPLRSMPFNGPLTGGRRVRWVRFPLDDFLALRGAAGCKVNDVALAVIAGALRRYLPADTVAGYGALVRALVPVSIGRPEERLALGNRVSAMLADLPIGIADPGQRLAAVAQEMRRLKETGQRHAFDLVLGSVSALPPPVGTVLARLAALRPVVHTVCTIVPAARGPRYVLGRRVREMQPIMPIGRNVGLGFAIVSYDRMLSISVTADSGLVDDVDRLCEALRAAEEELQASLGLGSTVPPPAGGGPAVADLMTTDVLTVDMHATLDRAWETMRVHRIRHLPVVDVRSRPAKLLGVVTHRDLLAAAPNSLAAPTEAERVRALRVARVLDVMEPHVSTATPGESAAEAGRRMVRHKVGCLPVVDESGRLVGIVTEEDFLRWATARMEAEAR